MPLRSLAWLRPGSDLKQPLHVEHSKQCSTCAPSRCQAFHAIAWGAARADAAPAKGHLLPSAVSRDGGSAAELCRLADMEVARIAVSRWLHELDQDRPAQLDHHQQDWPALLVRHQQQWPAEHRKYAPTGSCRPQLTPCVQDEAVAAFSRPWRLSLALGVTWCTLLDAD